eukprot:g18413.t1
MLLASQDAPETLQQEVDISPAGIERRKALLRTERGAGETGPDWRELDVDATGVLHESLAEQVPQVAQFGVDPMQGALSPWKRQKLPVRLQIAVAYPHRARHFKCKLSPNLRTLNMQTLSVDRECLNNVQNANASKYVISLNNKSWVNAEKACADEGLQLATPRTKEEMKALNVAMMQKNVQKVHIGLRRDVQFGQDRQDFLAGPWTDPSVFYWVDGETLDAEWPGWGGYGSAEGVFEIPVKQPHWEAFLDGCCYVGYFETVDQDGTKACPNGMGVSAVPLKQCEEAALKVVLPPGVKRGRTAVQAGYDVGLKDPAQPW